MNTSETKKMLYVNYWKVNGPLISFSEISVYNEYKIINLNRWVVSSMVLEWASELKGLEFKL